MSPPQIILVQENVKLNDQGVPIITLAQESIIQFHRDWESGKLFIRNGNLYSRGKLSVSPHSNSHRRPSNNAS